MKLVSNGKEISIDVYTENLKTTNLKIHELVFIPLSTTTFTVCAAHLWLSDKIFTRDSIPVRLVRELERTVALLPLKVEVKYFSSFFSF